MFHVKRCGEYKFAPLFRHFVRLKNNALNYGERYCLIVWNPFYGWSLLPYPSHFGHKKTPHRANMYFIFYIKRNNPQEMLFASFFLRVISVHSLYLTSFVILSFYRLPFVYFRLFQLLLCFPLYLVSALPSLLLTFFDLFVLFLPYRYVPTILPQLSLRRLLFCLLGLAFL